MKTRTLLLAILMTAGCFAQTEPAKPQPPEKKYFHLDVVVKELEGGKVINSRAYAMTVATDERTSVRTGGRIPITRRTSANTIENTFQDIGTNIDCLNVREIQNQLVLVVMAEVTTIFNEPDAGPVVRNLRWNSPVMIPLRKPTTVFSSDDATSKRQMQLEITASPIK